MARMQRSHFLVCVFASAFIMSGCSKPAAPRFHANLVDAAEKTALDDERRQNQEEVANILGALFGTPDEPTIPDDLKAHLNIDLIRKAAGPVNSDASDRKFGLFREHCVHCHGITGDGKGSLARFLKPYPRDYRQATFKFKTTDGKTLPSNADLMRILVEGINNTSMPSFRLLSDKDRESLVEYVKYLAVRGRAEAALYDLVKEVSATQDDPNPLIKFDYKTFMADTLVPMGQEWTDANAGTIEIPEPEGKIYIWTPANEREPFKTANGETRTYEKSIANGKALFFSESKGACYTCHGPTAMGDGKSDVDDDWMKQIRSVRATLEKDTNQSRQLGWVMSSSLPLRYNEPRNLRLGNYRFGNTPRDIYNKVHAGINGSGMPGKPDLKPEEKWDIVNYVLSLPYETGGGLGYDLRADAEKSQDILHQSK